MVEALKRLEYRGYDSAGIATINAGTALDRRRAVGKLVNLSRPAGARPAARQIRHRPHALGHPRRADRRATRIRIAPGPVAVVHNGIIENFRELRAELEAERRRSFTPRPTPKPSPLLAQSFLDAGLAPRDAAEQTIARLTGAFALAFLFDGEDDLMIAARKGSPLAIGHGDGEMFVGSDAIALAPLTDRITYLEEGDWAVLTRAGVEIRRRRRPPRQPPGAHHPDRRRAGSTRAGTSISWPRKSPSSRP